MAASPGFKVYEKSGEYIAACKYPEDAAAIVACRGDGTEIRLDHAVVLWVEGKEVEQAGNSYDTVAHTVYARCLKWDEAISSALHKNGSASWASRTRKDWNAAMRTGATLTINGIVCRLSND